jgi:hypothetical protein
MTIALATLWILLWAAGTAGVYWGFLNTPESTIGALALSAVLALIALALAGFTATGAIVIMSDGASLGSLRRAARAIPAVVPAAVIVLTLWWIAGAIDTQMALNSGPITAWFIARFGWDDVSWLFTSAGYFAMWLRWVVAGLLALSLMAGIVAGGWGALAQAFWIRRALRPRAVATATLWFAAFIVLPWVYLVPWRPAGLPPTSVEMVFIVGKLAIAALVMALGAALIVHEAVRTRPRAPDPLATAAAA